MLKIKVDATEVIKTFEGIEEALSPSETSRILNLSASYIDFKILERTARGIDIWEAPFKPYSALSKKLRGAKGLPTDKPDLFFTGQMLNALTHDSNSDEGRIFFLGGVGQGTPSQKAEKNNESRPFFGVSDQDKNEVFEIVIDEMGKLIK